MAEIPAFLRGRLESVLEPDEEILWLGQPRGTMGVCAMVIGLVNYIAAVACLHYFAFFLLASSIGTIIYIIVLLLQVCMLLLPFVGWGYLAWKKAHRTVYAITKRRALALIPERHCKFRLHVFQPEDICSLSCGKHFLMWREKVPGVLSGLFCYADGFQDLKDARSVNRLLLDTFVPLLGPMLSCSDPMKRLKAARALAIIGGRAEVAIPNLIDALSIDDALVRRLAARALGNLGRRAADASPALRQLQFDEHRAVAQAASEALAKIDITQAARALTS